MRRRLAIMMLLAMTPLAALVDWWLMPKPRISEASYARVHEGMTFAEVEEILGRPSEEFGSLVGLDDSDGIQTWADRGNWIEVNFAEGRVRSVNFFHRTLWERLDDWYHGAECYPPGRLEPTA